MNLELFQNDSPEYLIHNLQRVLNGKRRAHGGEKYAACSTKAFTDQRNPSALQPTETPRWAPF